MQQSRADLEGPVTSLAERVRRHIAGRPDAPALACGDTLTTYGELGRMSARAAEVLAAPELGAGAPVGIVGDKSPETVALILACLTAGRPALLPSPDLGAQSLAALLRRAGCSHVLRPGERPVAVSGPEAPPPGEPALLLTTSGSTGVPKIVPLDAGALAAFAAWGGAHFGLRPGAAVLNYAPLNFDLCLLDVWATLACGGCAVLVEAARAMDGRHLARLVAGHDVRLIQGVPLLFRLLSGAGLAHGCVEHVVVTGEAVALRTLAGLAELFPRAAMHNVYGCTETNDSFIYRIDLDHVTAHGAVPIGTPLPGVATRIVGPDGGDADAGELWVSTPFQTTGYLPRGDRADARFVPRPDGPPFFRSGDLVERQPDGCLMLTGRCDFQVKVRGVRTNLNEVEAVLLAHPSVAEAAVVAVPDEAAGHRLRAVIRPCDGARAEPLALRAHCAARMARVAVPSSFTVTETSLPKTSTGKVDRRQALALIAARAGA